MLAIEQDRKGWFRRLGIGGFAASIEEELRRLYSSQPEKAP